MKFIENIDENRFEKFVSKHSKSHFMQSTYFGKIKESKNFKPYYVGIEEDGNLVCAAMLLKKNLVKGYTYFYSPRGYVIDFNNIDLLKRFSLELKSFSKKHKALFIKIDPDVKRHDLDLDGNILGSDNYKLIDELKKMGYKHKGFNTLFINEQPRFTFRLDLNRSFDDVYSSFHSTTRKIFNKGNEYNLELYKGNASDIEDFYFTMEETAKRENLGCSSIEYYKSFYEIFNKNNMSDLWIVKVDINNLKELYNNKLSDINNKIEEVKSKPNKKTENKLKELNNELTKINKDIEALNDIKVDKLVLSSIITVKYNNKVWTVHGGNSNELRNLNSNYLLYYSIIKDAYDNGYKVVDFFGTSGDANPSKDSPIYGIHNFKKRLGGEYTEFIGEFDLVCKPFLYKVFNILIPIRRKIQKRKLRDKNV